VAKSDLGFVALSSLKKPADPASALAELRRIYFKTTKKTIEHDFAHAIELARSIESEAEREKASVFMEGINELRKEWTPRPKPAPQRKKKR
jgi:hypothetical protein